MKVLMVEDEVKLERTLAEGLREEGFAVTVAPGGSEGGGVVWPAHRRGR